jgi:hypothetical protein
VTAALYQYLRLQRSGFAILPLAKHKAYKYAVIAATYFAVNYITKELLLEKAGNPVLTRKLRTDWYYNINLAESKKE